MADIPTNSIICGDCRDRMKQIPDESVDLIYLDPPFFSGKSYDLIWGESRATIKSFEDAEFYKKICGQCGTDWHKNESGDDYARCVDPKCNAPLEEAKDIRMNNIDAYVGWLKPRLQKCYNALKPTGSIYVHLDWHAVHYVKVAMDEIFGMKNFQNEIIWCYRTGGATKKRFSRKHDNILLYSKTDDFTFNLYKDRIYYEKPFFDPKQDEDGRYYADVLPVDYWEIPAVINVSKERIGYPTQKPEDLLERIIKASSDEGDIVLDPFCGCGTTITVAQRLKRKWIGIDIEPVSCTVQQIRMEKTFGLEIPIIDLGKRFKEEELAARLETARKMNPYEFQDWIVELLNGKPAPRKSDDDGVDGWIDKPFGNLEKGDPIQVKRTDKVGRDVIKLLALNTQTIGREHGVVVGFGFTRTSEAKANEIRASLGITIELLTVKNLLMQTGKNTKSCGKHRAGEQAKLLK